MVTPPEGAASDPRPGGPDAKLCSEYIFEQPSSQASPRRNSRANSATHSNECLPHPRWTDTVSNVWKTVDQTPPTSDRQTIATRGGDVEHRHRRRARERPSAPPQEPEREADLDPRGHPALGREPRLSAEHARDRRCGRTLFALERHPPVEPARTRRIPAARSQSASCPRGAHRAAGHGASQRP